MHRMHVLAAAALGAALLAPSRAPAQSQYLLDGPGGTVLEITGLPAGPCGYPSGPLVSAFPYIMVGPCPTPGPVPPGSPFGDIAVDKTGDTIFVTDGFIVGRYSRAGILLNSMAVTPVGLGPLTGLGYDSAAGILWMTDSLLVAGVIPPPIPTCGPAAIVFPPFPSPFPAAGPITDLGWDPVSGTVVLGHVTSLVSSATPFGAAVLAPYPAGAAAGCPLPTITGLDVDTALGVPGASALYVTDGFIVSHELLGGGPVPPTFGTPFGCFPTLLPPVQGLAFAARAINYGMGGDTAGLVPPVIGSLGQSILPNPAFAVTLSGSVPFASAYLFIGLGAFCPPLSFFGNPFLVSPVVGPIGPLPVDPFGNFTLPAPLPGPGMLPPGVEITMQWIVRKGPGMFQTSNGLEFRTALP